MIPIRDIFINESSFKDHIEIQTNNYIDYLSNFFILLCEYNTNFSIIKKARILSAAIFRNDKEFAKFLMSLEIYDLPTIVKCCRILDSKRKLAQLNKKTATIKNPKKLIKHKSCIRNTELLNEGVHIALTKSKIKFIRDNWIMKRTSSELEHMALMFPTDQWNLLLCLLHLKPSDLSLSWFASYIIDGLIPENSLIGIHNQITSDNIKQIVVTHKLPYNCLKMTCDNLLTIDVKHIILSYTDTNLILKHIEDFNDEKSLEILYGKLATEELNMPYGELMKRIQMLKETNAFPNILSKLLEIAENKLSRYHILLNSFATSSKEIGQSIVVLGDASASMDMAIKTSSIITSILVKLWNAKMHLFRGIDEPITETPTNVRDVIDMMDKFKANGTTAPSASLYPYYDKKEIVTRFILVTDEEENYDYDGTNDDKKFFAELFKKYREDVYPAKLTFISFLENNKDGQMVSHLKSVIPDITKDITQFRLSRKNPDLRKLDELLNVLSMETQMHNLKLNKIKELLSHENINFADIYNEINNYCNVEDQNCIIDICI